MNLTIEHFEGQFGPTFNINFHRADGEDAFLSIKGCKIAQGKEGPFVSLPASKNATTGKYWNHVWADAKFQSAVMQLAGTSKAPPTFKKPSQDGAKARQLDPDSSIPF